MSRKILIIIKIVVSAGLIWLFFSLNDVFSQIKQTLKQANWFLLFCAFLLHLFGLWLSGWRWKVILDKYRSNYTLGQLVKFYLIGNFFSHFLPSKYGGDLVRTTLTSSGTSGIKASFAVIVYERGSGILILFIFALAAALLKITFVLKYPALIIFLLLSLVVFLLLGLAYFLKISDRLIPFSERIGRFGSFLKKTIAFIKTVEELIAERTIFRKIIFAGFLLQLNVVLHYFLISRGLNLTELPLIDLFLIVPLLIFVMSLPVSINGIGVRDWTLLLLFQPYGYSAAQALTFSFLDLFFNLVLGICGGFLFLAIRKSER